MQPGQCTSWSIKGPPHLVLLPNSKAVHQHLISIFVDHDNFMSKFICNQYGHQMIDTNKAKKVLSMRFLNYAHLQPTLSADDTII
jgi:hypothetical protein